MIVIFFSTHLFTLVCIIVCTFFQHGRLIYLIIIIIFNNMMSTVGLPPEKSPLLSPAHTKAPQVGKLKTPY